MAGEEAGPTTISGAWIGDQTETIYQFAKYWRQLPFYQFAKYWRQLPILSGATKRP